MIKTAAKAATIGLAVVGGTTTVLVVTGVVAGYIIYKKVMGSVGDLFDECLKNDIERAQEEDPIEEFEMDYE